MKRCSASLIIRDFPDASQKNDNKIPIFMSIRMAIIKKTRDDKFWQRYREKRTTVHCRWECIGYSPYKSSMEVSQKSKNRTTTSSK